MSQQFENFTFEKLVVRNDLSVFQPPCTTYLTINNT